MSALDKAIAGSVPLIPRPLVRKISRRYIAGDTLSGAMSVIQTLSAEEGAHATVDVLGEDIQTSREARHNLALYKRVIDAIYEKGLPSGLSVKLSGLGLEVDPSLCEENLEKIVSHAHKRGRFVRVDMENSSLTDRTIDLVLRSHRQRPGSVGAVLQAYLRTALRDARRLAEAGVSVRLCKGIYDEPRRLAYKDPEVVRRNYALVLEELLRRGSYVGIATHDELLVWEALRLIDLLELESGRDYEFQMLLGVDEEMRRMLLEEGHRVRVYVPFGEDWYEYSSRRLKENPRIARYVTRDVLGEARRAAGSLSHGKRGKVNTV